MAGKAKARPEKSPNIVFLTADRRPMESLPPEELQRFRRDLTEGWWRLMFGLAEDRLRKRAKGALDL